MLSSERRTTPKSDISTRENETFESKEDQYSPTTNPFGQRPDHRTPQGAEVAEKAFARNASGEKSKPDFFGKLCSLDNIGSDSKMRTESIRVALADAGEKLSVPFLDERDDDSALLVETENYSQSNIDEMHEKNGQWNLKAVNPIYAPENLSGNVTPRRSPSGTRFEQRAPASPSSLPISTVDNEANFVPDDHHMDVSSKKALAEWMDKNQELEKARNGANKAAELSRSMICNNADPVKNTKRIRKGVWRSIFMAIMLATVAVLALSFGPFKGKIVSPSFSKAIGSYMEMEWNKFSTLNGQLMFRANKTKPTTTENDTKMAMRAHEQLSSNSENMLKSGSTSRNENKVEKTINQPPENPDVGANKIAHREKSMKEPSARALTEDDTTTKKIVLPAKSSGQPNVKGKKNDDVFESKDQKEKQEETKNSILSSKEEKGDILDEPSTRSKNPKRDHGAVSRYMDNAKSDIPAQAMTKIPSSTVDKDSKGYNENIKTNDSEAKEEANLSLGLYAMVTASTVLAAALVIFILPDSSLKSTKSQTAEKPKRGRKPRLSEGKKTSTNRGRSRDRSVSRAARTPRGRKTRSASRDAKTSKRKAIKSRHTTPRKTPATPRAVNRRLVSEMQPDSIEVKGNSSTRRWRRTEAQ